MGRRLRELVSEGKVVAEYRKRHSYHSIAEAARPKRRVIKFPPNASVRETFITRYLYHAAITRIPTMAPTPKTAIFVNIVVRWYGFSVPQYGQFPGNCSRPALSTW